MILCAAASAQAHGTPIRSKVILHTPYIPHSTPSTFIWTPRTLIPTPHSLILIPHLYGTPMRSKVIFDTLHSPSRHLPPLSGHPHLIQTTCTLTRIPFTRDGPGPSKIRSSLGPLWFFRVEQPFPISSKLAQRSKQSHVSSSSEQRSAKDLIHRPTEARVFEDWDHSTLARLG
jgi:hypothetical protein